MSRQVKSSEGRTFSKSCVLRGSEAEGRKAVLREGRIHTRIADIGPDGLTSDRNRKVATSDVLDLQPVDNSSLLPGGPIPGIVGERGTITIPAEMRRRKGLQPGSPFLVEERGDEIVIRPADIVPRRSDPRPTLDGLLAGVTAENIHHEVPTGAALGGEA
jgi:AbrB family looped-hinge helix DNA binding protein